MTKNVRYVFKNANEDLTREECDIPEPGTDEVLIEVKACGVCHSDTFTKHGYPGIEWPRAPGHEIAGVVSKVGPGARASAWSPGDRVGVGWHGAQCFTCDPCRRGDFVTCKTEKVTGIHFDGGYQKYCVIPAEALAKIPDSLSFTEAAPLMCAGVTVFNGMCHNPKPPGSLVAVQGIGGLGHLAIQFAAKMGYVVVAVSRGSEKKEHALALGAHHYIDSKAQDAVKTLQEMGGADLVVSTAFDAKAMSSLIPCLGRNGTFVVIGASFDPLEVSGIQLLGQRSSVRGHPSGASIDSQDTMEFAAKFGVRPETIVFPFSKAQEAYDAMVSGKYRVVMDMTA